MKRIILLLLSLLVLLAGASGAAYLFLYVPHQPSPAEVRRQQVDLNLQAGRQLLNTGSAQSAIPWLQQAVSQAVDLDQQARADLNLGDAYLSAGMAQQGIALLKEVSTNIAYPTGYRSTAAQDAVGYYVSGKDTAFAVQTIFTGPTWGAFLQGLPTAANLNLAVKNSLLWILSFDTSLSSFTVYYRLANWYGEDLAAQTGDAEAQDVSQVEHYLQLGDATYPRVLAANAAAQQQDRNAVPPFAPSVVGNALTLKARALGALYLAKADEITFGSVVQVFAQALTLLDQPPSNSSSTHLYSYFHFAEFLANADPVANKAQIVGALSHLYERPAQYQTSIFFQGFLKQYGTNPLYKGNATWMDIVTLSKTDPRLQPVLINLGWSSNDFQ